MTDPRYETYVAVISRNTEVEVPSNGELTMSFAELGFDSLSSVELLLDLEDSLDLVFPEDQLSPETFRTPASLWQVVMRLLDE